MIEKFPFIKQRVTCKFTFHNNFPLSNGVSKVVPKTVHQLTNDLGCSLIQFSSPIYYQQKKFLLFLEQYLKVNLRFEFINYHYIMF